MYKSVIAVFISLCLGHHAKATDTSSTSPLYQWQQRLPSPKNVALAEYGSPLVIGQKIYIGALMENGLLVLDKQNGLLIDHIEGKAPVQAKPVLIDNQLLIADKAGNVSMHDLVTGDIVWTKSTGAPIVSEPLFRNGMLYVSTVDDVLYCLSIADGSLKWRYAHKVDPSRKGKIDYSCSSDADC